MIYYRYVISTRYDILSAYIVAITIDNHQNTANKKYRVKNIIAGVNVSERVGRNSYPLSDNLEKNGFYTDYSLVQKKLIKKIFTIKL